MRKPILAVWLCLPLGAWAYHEGPGQPWSQLDDVDGHVARADLAADEDWAAAVEGYEAALKDLPAERVHADRRIRLALNQARMLHKQLPKARAEFADLVAEMVADPAADAKLLDEARTAHASSQYYITWLMRLEGYTRAEWEPEIEIARQTYRLLAERAEARGEEAVAEERRQDLESAIKLARMELSDLQGLPLPSQ